MTRNEETAFMIVWTLEHGTFEDVRKGLRIINGNPMIVWHLTGKVENCAVGLTHEVTEEMLSRWSMTLKEVEDEARRND